MSVISLGVLQRILNKMFFQMCQVTIRLSLASIVGTYVSVVLLFGGWECLSSHMSVKLCFGTDLCPYQPAEDTQQDVHPDVSCDYWIEFSKHSYTNSLALICA